MNANEFPEMPEHLKAAMTFDDIRAALVKEIIKAEVVGDLRAIIIYSRQFTDAFPQDRKLAPIERAVKALFLQKLKDAKYHYSHICPVCKDHMIDQLCPDDIIRPYCQTCKKSYVPVGYDCEDEYGTKWSSAS